MGAEVVERMMIFDPAKGDEGTTWSGLPITPALVEATRSWREPVGWITRLVFSLARLLDRGSLVAS